MAVTVLLELQLKPESVDDTIKTFKDILPDTRAYDGCIGVTVTQNQDDPTNLILIEEWESRQHYEKYFAWRTETGVVDGLGKVVAAPPSIRYVDPVDA